MKKTLIYTGAAIGAALLIYFAVTKKQGQSLAGAAGAGVVGGVLDFGGGVAEGINRGFGGFIESVGSVVGVPVTNQTQCQQDLAAGNHWAASFSCPAGDFLGGVWKSTSLTNAAVIDAGKIEASVYAGGGGQFKGNGATGSW